MTELLKYAWLPSLVAMIFILSVLLPPEVVTAASNGFMVAVTVVAFVGVMIVVGVIGHRIWELVFKDE